MASDPTAENICSDVGAVVAARVREEYPYLKQGALESLVRKVTKDITDCLTEQAPVMASSKARINFFSLSPEMRNRIYELALNVTPGERGKIVISRSISTRKLKVPPLLQVSQQVRSETSALFFSNRTFSFKIKLDRTKRMCELIRAWLRRIGGNLASKITKVELNFEELELDEVEDEVDFEDDRELKKLDVLRRLNLLSKGVPARNFTIWYRGYDKDGGGDGSDAEGCLISLE